MAQKIQVEVIKKEQVTEKVYLVTFGLVEPPTIDFRAGQNMMLMIPASPAGGAPGVNRTMSIASPPSEKSELLMVHDISPMGPGSQWTLGLAVGDKATIVAPIGGVLSFIDSPKKKVMVATGTGIAPFHAMVLDYLGSRAEVGMPLISPRQGPDRKYFTHGDSTKAMTGLETAHLPARSSLVLYWGLRYETDVYWKEELDRISSLHPNVTWHQVLSKPSENWKGLQGHVTEHVLSMEKDMENSEFYLCWNKTMIEDVRTKLLERNVPKEQIKTELFY